MTSKGKNVRVALAALIVIIINIAMLSAIANMQVDEPARIELRAERSHITTDGFDSIWLTAYVYDAQGEPAADGTRINFTIGNATSNAYNDGIVWSMDNGSFSPSGSGLFTNVTRNGSASARFGWVPNGLGGHNSTIWAYVNGTDISATAKIYFAAPMAPLTGYVVNTSGTGLGGVLVTLHVMGYANGVP